MMQFPITKVLYTEPLDKNLTVEREIKTGGFVKFWGPDIGHQNQFWISSNAFPADSGNKVIAASSAFTEGPDVTEKLLGVIKDKKYKFVYVEYLDE